MQNNFNPITVPYWHTQVGRLLYIGEKGKKKHFRIVGSLGEGSMGTVLEAKEIPEGKSVAIKKINKVMNSTRMIILENMQLAKEIVHPNICNINLVCSESNIVVMERLYGQDLKKSLDDLRFRGTENFSLDDSISFIRNTALGMEVFHNNGLVIGDLSLKNIFQLLDGRIKLIDFDFVSKEMTVNSIYGTPTYMSPERLKGRYCIENDIYSLAICAYELLIPSYLFSNNFVSNNIDFLFYKRTHFHPNKLSSFVNSVPYELDRLMHAALDPNPINRPTAKEISYIC